MAYYTIYAIMIISFCGLSLQAPDTKGKVIGLLLAIVNALIFYKG